MKHCMLVVFFLLVLVLSLPLSLLACPFARKWYGFRVYVALYHRSETGKWPD